MKPKILIITGLTSLLLAGLFGFGDNLTELAPVFLLTGIGSFGWLIFRKTWSAQSDASTPTHPLAKASAILAILGVLCFGAAAISLLDPALEELAAAALAGGLLLILSLVARIAGGMMTKKVDTATGLLSISGIAVLTGILTVGMGVFYVVYALLTGLGIL